MTQALFQPRLTPKTAVLVLKVLGPHRDLLLPFSPYATKFFLEELDRYIQESLIVGSEDHKAAIALRGAARDFLATTPLVSPRMEVPWPSETDRFESSVRDCRDSIFHLIFETGEEEVAKDVWGNPQTEEAIKMGADPVAMGVGLANEEELPDRSTYEPSVVPPRTAGPALIKRPPVQNVPDPITSSTLKNRFGGSNLPLGVYLAVDVESWDMDPKSPAYSDADIRAVHSFMVAEEAVRKFGDAIARCSAAMVAMGGKPGLS